MAARVPPYQGRVWTPPVPKCHAEQMELPGCEPVQVGRVVAGLVEFWAERYEGQGSKGGRDFYLRPKRAGEQLLVSFGWRLNERSAVTTTRS